MFGRADWINPMQCPRTPIHSVPFSNGLRHSLPQLFQQCGGLLGRLVSTHQFLQNIFLVSHCELSRKYANPMCSLLSAHFALLLIQVQD